MSDTSNKNPALRLADAWEARSDLDSKALRKEMRKARGYLPPAVWPQIRRAFTPKGLGFFEFYISLKHLSLGVPPSEGLKQQFKRAVNLLIRIESPVDGRPLSPVVVNQIAEARSMLNSMLARLDQGRTEDPVLWARINNVMVPLIEAVARDKGIYLRSTQKGRERWVRFRKMSAKQEQVERLKDDDPESYALMVQKGKALKEIDEGIQRQIQISGMIPGRSFVMGRPVQTGEDPRTGEKIIFDRDGQVLTFEEYKSKRREQERQKLTLGRVPTRTEVPVEDLRSVDDDRVDSLSGEIEWDALTDDKARQGRLTKIFATKKYPMMISDPDTGEIRIEHVKVIVSGRYKGVFLDDMVNSQGRLIEGTAYGYEQRNGRDRKIPVRLDPSTREPYITTAEIEVEKRIGNRKVREKEQKLFLKIPGARHYAELRNAVKKLACNTGTKRGCIPSISYHRVEGSKAASFYFDPKDFAAIKEALKGMSLSKGALTVVKTYFQDLARAEQATASENLRFYSAENLGGFKTVRKNRDTDEIRKFDLLTKQKQALAWMDARGNNGVCALDTGVGKCCEKSTLISTTAGLVAIEDMNPGLTEPDSTAPVEGWSVLVDGEALPVKNFYYGGPKPTIKVRTRRGYEVEGSLIHPLQVRTPDGNETWVKTPDLEPGDYLCIERADAPFPSEDPALSVPLAEDFQQATRKPGKTQNKNVALFPVPSRMTPDLGRLLGYIVAEGWTNHHASISITQCPEKNPKVRADIEDLLCRLWGWEAQTTNPQILVSSVFLREYLLRLGVGMGVAKDKTIPKTILRSTKETARQFIRGLVDAEGYAQGSGTIIEFSTASEQLGRELQVLLLRFNILCSRRPKKVKGYDHTYWRVTITGEDAVRYWQEIGFVSQRKQAAFVDTPSTRNTNLDVVPHLSVDVGRLFDAILAKAGTNISGFRRLHGPSFDNTVSHVRRGRRNPTYSFLTKMLALASDLRCQEHPSFKAIAQVVDRRFFYDPIDVFEHSEAIVMDIEVDHPSHCFVGNGVLNHNTLVSMAMMQKLMRDGIADADATYRDPRSGKSIRTNGRFLFVSPGSLKGNLPKEVRGFLEREASQHLLGALDIISYNEFSRSAMSGSIPRSLRGVGYWKERERRMGPRRQAAESDPKKIWDIQLYTALFFDEAQELASPGSKKFKAANGIYHPRKILLTASPMEKEPEQAYLLAAITNNIDLSSKSEQAKKNRVEMRRHMERFTDKVGGRVVGVKEDPVVKSDLDTWVKGNIFYADKTHVEEFELPEMRPETMAVEMALEVESIYRDVTSTMPRLMKGLVGKFRDQGMADGKVIPEARDPEIERAFSLQFRPILKLLNGLSNYPKDALYDVAHMLETRQTPDGKDVPRAMWRVLKAWGEMYTPDQLRGVADSLGNPKLEAMGRTIADKLAQTDGSSRTLIFADDKKLCMMAGRHLAETIPGWHVVALNDNIRIFSSGGEVREISFDVDPREALRLFRGSEDKTRAALSNLRGGKSHIPLPFRRKAYRRWPELPAHRLYNVHYKADRWQQFVMQEVVSPNSRIKTCTLLGQTYQFGHNLQAFNTVVHLDRDTFSSENMKQRTARAWRQGQAQPVDEITLDTTFAHDPENLDEFDATFDEIRRWFQSMEADLFDRIIKDAQAKNLGVEFNEITMRDASNQRLDREVMELMASPFLSRSKPPRT